MTTIATALTGICLMGFAPFFRLARRSHQVAYGLLAGVFGFFGFLFALNVEEEWQRTYDYYDKHRAIRGEEMVMVRSGPEILVEAMERVLSREGLIY